MAKAWSVRSRPNSDKVEVSTKTVGNLALALNGVRSGLHDKITLYAGSVYATNDPSDAKPHVRAGFVTIAISGRACSASSILTLRPMRCRT